MANPDDFRSIHQRLNEMGDEGDNHLYYLATSPEFYPVVISHLSEEGMVAERHQTGFRRLIIEKPFGRDRASAVALNRELLKAADENQVYRIDHYIGKETVQNLLVFRFGNAIFEPLWNRNYIDHVQITVAESEGVGHRAGFYDKAGVLRDMFQNHLMQLLTLVAMEPPALFEANALRDEKVKILQTIRDIAPEASAQFTVRGQYNGYRGEKGVDPNSTTETFGAVELFVDNWRWHGVPFYLRSGKMLTDKMSEVVIRFHRPPHQIFDIQSGATELSTNHLSICLQPEEGFRLRFITKVPDQGMHTRPVDMNFLFRDSFGEKAIPEAYERLLLDAISGDPSLFIRGDEIELAWKVADNIREGWEGDHAPALLTYEPGTWGPSAADRLLGHHGRWWIQDCASDRVAKNRPPS
jgi:glucose-6-phosphate 1-dehydrogenase